MKRTLSKIVNIREDERTKARTILSLLTVSLLIVLVSSVGIIQNNTANCRFEHNLQTEV